MVTSIVPKIKIQPFADRPIHRYQKSYVLMVNGFGIDVNHSLVNAYFFYSSMNGTLTECSILYFTARMFDYFDNGVMEELQHRLLQTVTITNGLNGSITFNGRSVGRRVTATGSVELLIKWNPSDMYVSLNDSILK